MTKVIIWVLKWQPTTQFLHLKRTFYKSVIFKSLDTAVYTNISHCCDKPTTAHKSIINKYCFLQVLLPQKNSFQVLNAAVCTKMLILISPLPNVCISCVEVEQKETNLALLIPFMPWNKAIFGLRGLEFCQKMRICMFN